MAVTTFQVFGILALTFFLIIVIWIYVVSLQRKKFLDSYIYARGANSSLPPNTGGTTNTSQLNLSCGEGRQICVFRATQICSGSNTNNFEYENTDPFLSDGSFNPSTTIDRTSDLENKCNGNSTCQFTFDPSTTTFPDGTGWSCPVNSQFLSSYTCVTSVDECQNYIGSKNTILNPNITTS